MHRRDRRLPERALPDAVRARFGKEQRLVSGDVLKPCEVRAQLVLAVEVDVERTDVEEREIEKFRRREVDVREKRFRRGFLAFVIQAAEKALHTQPPVPPDHASRNLVAEREHEHGGMASELAGLGHEIPLDLLRQPAVVQKRHVLRPRQTNNQLKAGLRGEIENLRRGWGIQADSVDPELSHQAEVFRHTRSLRKLKSPRVRDERAVSHALDEKAVVSPAEEFAVGDDAALQYGRRLSIERRIGLNGDVHGYQGTFGR